jgi:hypothetical protein
MIEVKNVTELKKLLKRKRDQTIKIIFLNNDSLNTYYSQKVNKYKNACGCDTGAIFTGLSIVLLLVLKVVGITLRDSTITKQLIYAFIFIVSLSLVGKFVGIVISKIKLKIILSKIDKISK